MDESSTTGLGADRRRRTAPRRRYRSIRAQALPVRRTGTATDAGRRLEMGDPGRRSRIVGIATRLVTVGVVAARRLAGG